MAAPLLEVIKSTKQEHILEQVPELLDQGISHPIYQQLSQISIENSLKFFNYATSNNSTTGTDKEYLPLDSVISTKSLDALSRRAAVQTGFEFIYGGKVAAVILSGGQGTRLGFPGPKGMFDKLGLLSKKTIFQLHVEKVIRIRQLSASAVGGHSLPHIPLYIMTSDLNHKVIVDFFKANNFFGFPEEDIIFFEQGLEPCFTNDGKMIIESPTKLSMAPDGNGGIYQALDRSGCILDMKKRGVEYLHIYGIDNVLTKSLDPLFVGLAIQRGVKCANKVVWRANKSEKVGVTAQSDGKMYIIEYSEIPAAMRDAVGSDGKLLFGAANICNHFLTLQFIVDDVLPKLECNYHSASKKIPFMDPVSRQTVTPTGNNGVKLEMFIFDVFPLAGKDWLVVEGEREDEFAPVKNEPGNPQDSPDTALKAISDQGRRWLTAAGVNILGADQDICEISAIVSYEGEGLDSLAGSSIALPVYLDKL